MGWPVGWTIPGEWRGVRYDVTPQAWRAADGLAGRLDDRETVGPILSNAKGGQRTTGLNVPLVYNPYRTLERDGSVTSGFAGREVVDALHGPTGNKEPLVALPDPGQCEAVQEPHEGPVGSLLEASLLPLGLDSHRYRCCGNGVVSSVAEWIGRRLLSSLPFPYTGMTPTP